MTPASTGLPTPTGSVQFRVDGVDFGPSVSLVNGSATLLGVISLLTLISAYKEFLWPMLVLPKPANQPISVVLPRLESSTDYAQFLAALFVSVSVPVVLFLIFQRQFLRAAGNAGALKG